VNSDVAHLMDTHVHVRSPDETRYPLAPTGIGSEWWVAGDWSTATLLSQLDVAGVASAVLVQAVGPYGFDNSYVLDSAGLAPDRVSVVAAVDLNNPGAREHIKLFGSHPAVVGVRFFGMTRNRSWIGSPAVGKAFDAAADAGLTVVVTVPGDCLGQVRQDILTAQTPVVLDHCGFPRFEDGLVAGGEEVWKFAMAEHVALKVTTHSFEDAAASRVGDDGTALVANLAEHFGAGRMMWGSDFPQTSRESYSAVVSRGRNTARGLSPPDRALFLGGTARRLFPRAV
jgi:L-fuconolactonase